MLGAQHRLRKTSDIDTVFTKGKKLHASFFMFVIYKNSHNTPRFTAVVSKKVHKFAVRRNSVKRKARHAFQQIISHLHTGVDIVCVVKTSALEATQEELYNDIVRAMKSAKLYTE